MGIEMKLKVKQVDVMAGVMAAGMDPKDCAVVGVKDGDRVRISGPKDSIAVILMVSDEFISPGTVLLSASVIARIGAADGGEVDVSYSPSPESVRTIRRKMDRQKLSETEIRAVVNDIYSGSLSNIEISSWLTALYINGMDIDEIAAFARAMVDTGDVIRFDKGPVYDFHSMGG
ncbi:MAG: molybdopterin dinucleotide binding domain-containing protein, partial [Methanomethylophilus sp.]|nr:molybdopterin dinucleotide binding domain-containing protein [Methanomethylophilus sp.]